MNVDTASSRGGSQRWWRASSCGLPQRCCAPIKAGSNIVVANGAGLVGVALDLSDRGERLVTGQHHPDGRMHRDDGWTERGPDGGRDMHFGMSPCRCSLEPDARSCESQLSAANFDTLYRPGIA